MSGPHPSALAPTHASSQSVLDGLDETARQMEMTWGVGRLRVLVSDFLRLKFDAQAEKLNTAITDGKPEFIVVQAEGMRRAWLALDKAAREAGYRPLDPNIWEIVLPTAGVAVAVVRTEAEASIVAKDRLVFTLAEIGGYLEKNSDAMWRVRKKHPGTLLTMKPKSFDWSKGDDIPF